MCSAPLEVGLWEFDTFLNVSDGPSRLIAPEDIDCQAARVRIVYGSARVDDGELGGASDGDRVSIWVTVGLTKVCYIDSNYSILKYD